ncbi:hypothetical protein B9Z55_015939 [Caenorhabditis nigoni]|uniref:Uncharacterized protein n=1 Tax=Caenorhabditis nigoni TaxID=1611254 RepID=A0A2G5UCG0_9PELO|nr:hypothetical protein B9Z55_015939 [Caenorhabditis nigoni]
MARLRLFTQQPDHTCRNFLESFLGFIINPLWACVILGHKFYTYLRPFHLTHFTFWHCLAVANYSFLWVFAVSMSSESDFTQRIFGYVYVLYCIVVSCEVISIPKGGGISKEWKVQSLPKVQNLNHVISGFFGMISSVWIAFGCLLALSFGFRALIFCSIYMLALCFFIVSYMMISNVLTHLYLILPPENQPFSGIKLHVVLLGLFHLAVGIASVFFTVSF